MPLNCQNAVLRRKHGKSCLPKAEKASTLFERVLAFDRTCRVFRS